MSYEERIREARDDMSSSFGALADFLLDSYIEAAFLSATELAHRLDLDPATVVRFAQSLGYQGYPPLQREIQTKTRRQLLIEPLAEANGSVEAARLAIHSVTEHLKLVERSFPTDQAQLLIKALDEAERVIILAEGLSAAPARGLAAVLESSGCTVHRSGGSPSELALAMAGARKRDLIIGIEVSDESPFVGRALQEAVQSELKTAALVAAPSAGAARHAEIILAAHASPHAGVGQILVESMILALSAMLSYERPGRFSASDDRTQSIVRRLTASLAD